MERVIINVQGGVPSAVQIPANTMVVIRDYDDGEHCESDFPSECSGGGIDEAGDHYHELREEAGKHPRPRLFQDGDHWCALYGENLQEGAAGFGKTPEEALRVFREAWREGAKRARVCVVCGKPFTCRRRSKKYCTQRCKMRAARKRAKEESPNV